VIADDLLEKKIAQRSNIFFGDRSIFKKKNKIFHGNLPEAGRFKAQA
jgi:hypothetical protein